MDATIREKLIALNRQFYQTFALQFSDTRMQIQPGVRRLLDEFTGGECFLDLGCGNGELAREMENRGFQGIYTGLDFSPKLLDIARDSQFSNLHTRFFSTELTTLGWADVVSSQKFDIVLAFAVLHHQPGTDLRQQFLYTILKLLKPTGRFYHSEWQFLKSERLKSRIQPWDTIGLSESDVEPGDYLLDWRRGGYGLRYIHHFTEGELADLASRTGFCVINTFYSDGKEGNLGLYQIWEPG